MDYVAVVFVAFCATFGFTKAFMKAEFQESLKPLNAKLDRLIALQEEAARRATE